MGSKVVLGWREWLELPDLGIPRIKAKLDTGARSSALHAYEVETHDRPEGPVVRFKVHPLQRSTMVTVVAEAPLLEERWITSSNGHRALRPVILTHVSLGGESWPIEVTLTARDEMGFRMLLGRQALRRRFLVDAGRSDLAERGIVVPKLVSTRAKAPRTKEPSA